MRKTTDYSLRQNRAAYLRVCRLVKKKPSKFFKNWSKARLEAEAQQVYESVGRIRRFFALRKIGEKKAWRVSKIVR